MGNACRVCRDIAHLCSAGNPCLKCHDTVAACPNRLPRSEWKLTKFQRSSIHPTTTQWNAFSLFRRQLNRSCLCCKPNSVLCHGKELPSTSNWQEFNSMVALTPVTGLFVHLVGVRASFHIQRLRPPRTIKATTLGHNGIEYPATITSGRITSRTNCAMAIRPNTTLATSSPAVWEFMLSCLPNRRFD
jgi:hypothetical protein